MNSDAPSGWEELAAQWKRHSAPISAQDLAKHARRDRRNFIAVLVAELLAAGIGVASATWLAMAASMPYLGWGIALGIVIFTVVAIRWQRRAVASLAADVISTLTAARDREARLLDLLASGRAVVLAGLAAVVIAASAQLRHFEGRVAWDLLPFVASGSYLLAVLITARLLKRQAQRRAAILDQLSEQLGGVHSQAPNTSD